MSEELLKELLEETKKQNKIQESIEREMKLQNNLMAYDMEENDVKSSGGGRLDVFRINSKGGYLNSNINKVINAMFDGFEKGTRNEGMTSLVGLLAWYVRNNKLTNHNARRIVMEAAKNSEPPMDMKELSTIWNSIAGRVNNLE